MSKPKPPTEPHVERDPEYADPDDPTAHLARLRGGRRGPRRYGYKLADCLALTGDSPAAFWKALARSKPRVRIDDFGRFAPWLVARAAALAARKQRKRARRG